MSHEDLNSLESILALVPCDWDLRLALIQAYVLRDQIDEAKRLVRESPDAAGPAPPYVQFRLHRLLTEGRSAAEEFAQEDTPGVSGMAQVYGGNAIDAAITATVEDVSSDGGPVDYAIEEDNLAGSAEGLVGTGETTISPEQKPVLVEEGFGASRFSEPGEPEGKVLIKVGVSEERQWGLDHSRFVIESAEDFRPLQREADAGRKVSAFSFALMFHMIVVLILGAIVIAIPLPTPPQIIAVNVAADRILDVPPKRVDKNKTPDRSAASAQATMVISSSSPSPVTVPDFEETNFTDVSAYLTDMKAGLGMSLEGEAEESDVNFFGIQSGGRKIAFIVDASPTMLVDEKGGMFAYDRVKDEVSQMLASLNRGTSFNILLYEGKRLKVYQSELVQARPSNVRLAIEWLDPLNRNYESLGLGRAGGDVAVSSGNKPIASGDITGYAKAVQLALEMDVNTVFCIAGGYLRIARAAAPMTTKVAGTPGKADPKEQAAWNKVVNKTREWLRRENEARKKKGLAPKVVTNFSVLVRQVTGATPPRARGGSGGGSARGLAPYTPEEIEEHVKNLVSKYYRDEDKSLPQLNLVLFLGKGEDIGDYKDHFRRLTRRNKGKLKILEGLDALEDVTAGG